MKKQILKIGFGLALMFTMFLGLTLHNAEATETMCKTYFHFYPDGSFVCGGSGNIICWYPCSGGNQQ